MAHFGLWHAVISIIRKSAVNVLLTTRSHREAADSRHSLGNKPLYTIGYEGAELGELLMTLRKQSIEQVIDVRELPLSRKRGFSKNSLKEALNAHGIEYLHIRALGDPKAGRMAARSGDFVAFRRLYETHLKLKAAQDALIEASRAAKKKTSVLLCYELDFENCHRSIVASSLSFNYGFMIHHLYVNRSTVVNRKNRNGQEFDRALALG